ncbi:hypothetical protein D3C81_2274890 [compost metagenome]
MHLVVFDPQIIDAGTCAFARFQIDQELPGIFRQAAQLIQLGIKAACNHAAIAHHRRRFHRNRSFN